MTIVGSAISAYTSVMTNSVTPFQRRLVRRRRDRAAAGFSGYNFLLRHTLAEFVERLADVKRQFNRVLVLGCHTGQVAGMFAHKPDLLVQADFSQAMARLAGGIVVDEEALPFANGSFRPGDRAADAALGQRPARHAAANQELPRARWAVSRRAARRGDLVALAGNFSWPRFTLRRSARHGRADATRRFCPARSRWRQRHRDLWVRSVQAAARSAAAWGRRTHRPSPHTRCHARRYFAPRSYIVHSLPKRTEKFPRPSRSSTPPAGRPMPASNKRCAPAAPRSAWRMCWG